MFFILSKILGFATQPFIWIVACFVLYLFFKKPKLKRLSKRLGIILFLVFANAFILDEVNRLWEISFSNNLTNMPNTGVILGGMTSYDITNNHIQFHAGSDRLWQGVKLLKCDKLNKVVITGGAGSILHQDLKEADHIAAYLMDVDLADSGFYFENQSKNTFENAINTKAIFEANNWPLRITLITSSSHMRRAQACFEKQGFEVFPYVTNRIGGPRKFEFDHLLIPSVATLNGWNGLIHEIIGYVTYQLLGYC
jgi:uncharacterized SAM-binding protein YcdF (DUF218 family)